MLLHPVGVSLSAICLLSFAVYSPLLYGEFLHFDDGQQIFDNLWVKHFTWSNFADALFTNYTGKGSAPSFAVSMLNWAVTPHYMGFAAVNLLFFMGLILLFYRFTALFTADNVGRLSATAIYAVHSVNADLLGWMASRCHIMGATFILSTFVFWQKYQDDISKSKRFLWYLLAVMSAAVAVWNKGIFLVIPGLIIVYDLYRRRRISLLFLLDKIPIAAIGGLPLLYTPLKNSTKHLANPGIGRSLQNTLINDAGLILEYLYRLVVPGPTAVSIDVYPVKSLFEVSEASSLLCLRMPPIFNISVLALLLAGLLYLLLRFKSRNGFFLFVFILIALSPVMNIPPRWVDFAFRFAQMPLFFFCIGVGSLSAYLGTRVHGPGRAVLIAMFAIYVGGHGAMSFRQARYWDTELGYWLACTKNFPDSVVCQNKAGWLLESAGRLEEAAAHALQIHEYSMNHLPNRTRPTAKKLAEVYEKMGRKEDALFYFNRSLLIDPLNANERKGVSEKVQNLEREIAQLP